MAFQSAWQPPLFLASNWRGIWNQVGAAHCFFLGIVRAESSKFRFLAYPQKPSAPKTPSFTPLNPKSLRLEVWAPTMGP